MAEADDTSSSSEEEEPLVDETDDKYFFKALSCLKNKDPKIYDPQVLFFPKEGEKGGETNEGKKSRITRTEKGLYLRDYERDMVVKAMKKEDGDGEHEEDEDEAEKYDDDNAPYAVQQKTLKESFKAVLDNSDSEDDGLLTVKEKTTQDGEKEEEEYKAWLKGNKEELSDKETEQDLKPLQNYWSKPDLDPNEQFLRDYILNRRYLEEGEAEDDGVSEDGELLEMQEKFETDYNLRFENDNVEVKRYPRMIDGSLRKTDDRRKEKRKERNERKKLNKSKKREEIAKNQKQKLLEFKEQVEKIKKLTGNDQLGFKDEEIFGDEEFNPEEHDRKMQELFGDAFYSAEDGNEKPDFGNEEDLGGWNDDDGGGEEISLDQADPDNMDLEAPGSSSRKTKKESRSRKKRKEKKKKTFSDIMDVAKPVYDPNVHSSYQKYIDEYYGMDCEDFIDDIPCKFKYRQTIPNDYGLTVEEILAADDKELNQWVSAKKLTKLRPDHVEKNEVKIYKQKAQDFNLKKKILASVYGSPKPEEDDVKQEESEDAADNAQIDACIKKKGTKRGHSSIEGSSKDEMVENKQGGIPTAEDQNAPESKKKKKKSTDAVGQKPNGKPLRIPNTVSSQQNGFSKKSKSTKGGKNKWKGDNKKNSDPLPTVSDTRLLAYDINPKKLKKKLKFKK